MSNLRVCNITIFFFLYLAAFLTEVMNATFLSLAIIYQIFPDAMEVM